MTDDVDLLRRAATKVRETAGAARQPRWSYDGYCHVSAQDVDRQHERFEKKAFDEGHTLERHGSCPTCGEWNERPNKLGWGCELYYEDYRLDPEVARVPPHHGSEAGGVHEADADHIALFDPTVALAVAVVLDGAIERWTVHEGWMPEGQVHALALARAILREES